MRIAVAASVIILSACSGDDAKDEISESQPVEKLYNDAYKELADRNYKKAVAGFEEVERQHPYSEWAVKAQIMGAYGSYTAEEYEDAIAILERFVKLYPGNADTPYAFYLKALCYYEQISDVGRDQKKTAEALQALREVISRYPESDYARDARIKLDLTQDHLAGKEMEVGRYYLKRKEYLAAINRFQFVVDNFQTTSHVPEALHRLVEAYLALGITEEAKKNAAVLGHNYPGSSWYRDSYQLLEGTPPESSSEASGGFWQKLLP